MSVTPYGKDKLPDRKTTFFMRLAGVRFGALNCSRWTGFESPDPLHWTRAGYAVVQADVRGMHASEGRASALSDTDAEDYAELIAWAARQSWSTGKVGLIGVSYLAMSQWRVAALRPPALAAIVPWEGVTDLLRELAYQDGVPETKFVGTWWKVRMRGGHNPRSPMAEDFVAERDRHPLDDFYWASKRPALERIEVPALVCASWSDHGLHTRGSLEGFERIQSKDKWLYTHGGRKWETFHGDEARAVQRCFLDRFLKDEPNGFESTPRVRLAVRQSRDRALVRGEPGWPLARVWYAPLFLDAAAGQLNESPPAVAARTSYDPCRRRSRARFVHRFARDTELTGSMALKLWVETSEGDDLDLFVVVRKLDARGREVEFFGFNGYPHDAVAKGWLRASHRALDPARSRPGRPFHSHASVQPVAPGEPTPIELEVLASSTHFEAGSSLLLDVLGCDAARYPGFRHERAVNRGRHTVHSGGRFDSHLLAPFVTSGAE
jgi:predicted acyl esterase